MVAMKQGETYRRADGRTFTQGLGRIKDHAFPWKGTDGFWRDDEGVTSHGVTRKYDAVAFAYKPETVHVTICRRNGDAPITLMGEMVIERNEPYFETWQKTS